MLDISKEYIADSEDEDSTELQIPQHARVNGSGVQADVSRISEFTTGRSTHAVPHSAIQSFATEARDSYSTTIDTSTPNNTNSSSIAANSTASSSRPRPRPRPVGKAREAAGSSRAEPTLASSSSARSNDVPVGAAFHGDFSMGIAERAKRRSRKANTPPPPPVHVLGEVIELSSEDEIDSLSSKPDKKVARPKPKPVNRDKVASKVPSHLVDTSMDSEYTFPVPSSSFPVLGSDPIPRVSPTTPPTSSAVLRSSPLSSPGHKRLASPRLHTPPADPVLDHAIEDRDTQTSAHLMPPPPGPPPFFDDLPPTSPPPAPVAKPVSTHSELSELPSSPPEPQLSPARAVKARTGRKSTSRLEDAAITKAPVRRSRKKTTVEVIIETPPKKKRKSAGPSDGDSGDLPPVPVVDENTPPQPHTSSASRSKPPPSTSRVPDSDEDDEVLILPSPAKPKAQPKGKAKAKAKAKAKKSTKRKQTEDSPDEAGESPKKKKRAGKKAVVPDDEEVLVRPAARKRVAVPSSDEENVESAAASKPASSSPAMSAAGKATSEPVAPVEANLLSGSSESARPSAAPSSSSSSVPRPARQFSTPVRHASTPGPVHDDSKHIIARNKSTPMSELIRRASNKPHSPVIAGSARSSSSKSALANIAPLLHARRTPLPRLPPPPEVKKRKTKKELELEDKWMFELEDEVQGWFDLDEKAKNKHLKRKRDAYYTVDD